MGIPKEPVTSGKNPHWMAPKLDQVLVQGLETVPQPDTQLGADDHDHSRHPKLVMLGKPLVCREYRIYLRRGCRGTPVTTVIPVIAGDLFVAYDAPAELCVSMSCLLGCVNAILFMF